MEWLKKPKKVVKKIIPFELVDVEVGKTLIELTDVNGEIFRTMVYGGAYQFTNYGMMQIGKINIQNSKNNASDFLRLINIDQNLTIVDDQLNPTQSYSARFKRAVIVDTESHKIKVQTYI